MAKTKAPSCKVEVTLGGVAWNPKGTTQSVQLKLEHCDKRPDAILSFLSKNARGAVEMNLRVTRVERQATWKGIALIDSATWTPPKKGTDHPMVKLSLTVDEGANDGPKAMQELVRFRMDLGEAGIHQVEAEFDPYDGPLFAAPIEE